MTLKPDGYLPRLLDPIVERRLAGFGALEIVGAKFCGKTWTAQTHGDSIVRLDNPQTRQIVEAEVELALDGEQPHIIDEWQDVPGVWDAVRRSVDDAGNSKGMYLLTGSSTVDKSKVSHSGTGRIASVCMRSMSLSELGVSDRKISLAGLFEGEFKSYAVDTSLKQLADCICVGGWPASIGVDKDVAIDLPSQCIDALCNVSAVKSGLDPSNTRSVAISLARNMGKAVTYKTLYNDSLGMSYGPTTDEDVMRQRLYPYMRFLKDQYFIEEQPGWDAPVKSRSRVRTNPRRCFADPSLPAALLGLSQERLLREGQLFGNLFEELCLHDLRIYASAMNNIPEPEVRYYSDADGLEVDAIIELPDGRWGAFEVKLGDSKVPEAEKSLIRLRDKVMRNPAARNPEPSVMAVIVGNAGFARKLDSGVCVVPITSLTA